METFRGRFEPTRFDDLAVTVDFHCHSACRFCIVQEGMNRFRGVSYERFAAVVEDNARTRRYRRVTFTGGEVTLEKKLFDYVELARRSGSFEHVRLQTNGRTLNDEAFARRLRDAGVDEFYVSLHGHDAATQDHIAQRPGGFAETMAGLAHVKALGACLMINTVITTLNVDTLAEIVDTVRPFSPARMELWNYLPMEDFADTRGLLAPMSRLVPGLRRALDRCREHGIEPLVKYVPRCLLGPHEATLDNSQNDVVIAEAFYDPYPKFACLFEAKCEHAESCLGLHHPYIHKFGWEQSSLVPVPRTTPYREPDDGPLTGSDSPGQGVLEVVHEHPIWLELLGDVTERHGATVRTSLQRRQCTFSLRLPEGSVEIVLTARVDDAPALMRTRSFNLHYRNVEGGPREALAALVRDAMESVRDRDHGQRRLDARKGLVGDEAIRRMVRSREPLRARGFRVLERSHEQHLPALRAALDSLWRELGEPTTFSTEDRELAPGIVLGQTGLGVHRLLERRPELEPLLLTEPLIDAIEAALGRDFVLEVASAVVVTRARPFFAWHTHIDGDDEGARSSWTTWPRYERPERLTAVIYLDDLDDDGGPLLVMPRAIEDPTEPPSPAVDGEWEGQVVVRVPAGSTVLLEQCTWHAARQMRREGVRRFIGLFARRSTASPSVRVDPSLRTLTGPLARFARA